MKAVVARWGNSLAVRIPAGIARELGLEEGVAVDVTNDNGRVVVEAKRRYALKDLLKGINSSNLHEQVDFGGAKGREVW
jgi:antitoxin MazE